MRKSLILAVNLLVKAICTKLKMGDGFLIVIVIDKEI